MTQGQFLALVHGTPEPDRALCRVHRGSIVGDMFCSTPSEGGRNLREALERIEANGSGVVVYIPGAPDLARFWRNLRGRAWGTASASGSTPRARSRTSTCSRPSSPSRMISALT